MHHHDAQVLEGRQAQRLSTVLMCSPEGLRKMIARWPPLASADPTALLGRLMSLKARDRPLFEPVSSWPESSSDTLLLTC